MFSLTGEVYGLTYSHNALLAFEHISNKTYNKKIQFLPCPYFFPELESVISNVNPRLLSNSPFSETQRISLKRVDSLAISKRGYGYIYPLPLNAKVVAEGGLAGPHIKKTA
ncbi:hypothetical protein RF11_02842 [Thelohanellus kitauei]|uniref:Uncharacterized protein n=1 Tax=Thelohanellus kitauei TaxID=669202 RepID=A0A0C2IBL4_THEKT|nr:hypothetical protein RF11_02842 [Thelohanellus kitauei]